MPAFGERSTDDVMHLKISGTAPKTRWCPVTAPYSTPSAVFRAAPDCISMHSGFQTTKAMYSHGSHESAFNVHKLRTVANSAAYLVPHLKPGMKILDVGCGPGSITVDFANYVPGGDITGLEYTPAILEQARAHAAATGAANVDFVQGDAHALPFADATFDVVHAHQVLQHIGDPVLALREMRRVAKPGGLVAARDSDWGALTWFPDTPGLREWHALYARIARGNGGEPEAGRRLKAWAREAGFDPKDVACTAATWCFSAPEEREYWGGSWAERIVKSDLAKGAAREGASGEDLERMSQAWRAWVQEEDGWLAALHGEIICRV
ncbi:UbiE family methyltransferase [Phanerochaete sordida]|uniref:UbiE family methyltransferase n=1 Tax=Phanerochaete sordida TaxID=48140 RepID=A0A9P3GNJ4_9APHY|nr:UbiE family methyltransferase [Phanerochaete sordida]